MEQPQDQTNAAGGLSAVDRSVRAWLEAQRINGGSHGFECVGVEKLTKFAESMIIEERVACELRCAKTVVLLDGHHGYTALKVQQMMMDAISMRSNVTISGSR